MKKPDTPKADTPEGERIAKYLSRAGVASRREAERMIETGQVSVNGKVIDSPALNITPKDRIVVNGKPVAPPERARLWLYYKPDGLVTSASDEKGRETVFDNLPEDMPRVMSIGRLDLNSEGLLLLTNDGELKRRLELPSTGWLRKYRVRVKGNPTDVDLEPLRRGITVDGEKFQPMQVVMDRHQGANAWLTVGLREGKNREIRRAMMEIGLTVNRLIRTSYGPFRLNEMQPGDVEEIRAKVLKDQLGMTGEDSDAPSRPGPKSRSVTPRKPAGSATSDEPRRSIPRSAARKSDGSAPRWLDEDMTTKPRTGFKTTSRTTSAPRGKAPARARDDDDAPARRSSPTSRYGEQSRTGSAKPASRRDHDDAAPRHSTQSKARAQSTRDHDEKPRSFGTSAAKSRGAAGHGAGSSASKSGDQKSYGKSAGSRSSTAKTGTPRTTTSTTKSGAAKPASRGSAGSGAGYGASHGTSKPRSAPTGRPGGSKPRSPRKD